MRRRRRLLAAFAGAATVVTGATTAYGYWTASGSGSGTATSGTTGTALVLSPGVPVAALYPGGTTDVALTVTNPNPLAEHVDTLRLDAGQGTTGYAVDVGHAACGFASLHYADQTNSGSGWTVPAAAGGVDGSLAVTLPGALAMDVDGPSSCQGATFTVYLTAAP